MNLIQDINETTKSNKSFDSSILSIVDDLIIESLDLLEGKTFTVQQLEELDLDFNKFASEMPPEEKARLRSAVDAAKQSEQRPNRPVKRTGEGAPKEGERVIVFNGGLPKTVVWNRDMAKKYNPQDFKPFKTHPRFDQALARLQKYATQLAQQEDQQSQARGKRLLQAIKSGELASMKSYAPDATLGGTAA